MISPNTAAATPHDRESDADSNELFRASYDLECKDIIASVGTRLEALKERADALPGMSTIHIGEVLDALSDALGDACTVPLDD